MEDLSLVKRAPRAPLRYNSPSMISERDTDVAQTRHQEGNRRPLALVTRQHRPHDRRAEGNQPILPAGGTAETSGSIDHEAPSLPSLGKSARKRHAKKARQNKQRDEEAERARQAASPPWQPPQSGFATAQAGDVSAHLGETQNPPTPGESDARLLQPSSSKSPSWKRAKDPLRPTVSAEYMRIANAPQMKHDSPQPLLVVLDLNGTLGFRKKSSTYFRARPNVQMFLRYLLANHAVMVWSSARPKAVEEVCAQLFTTEQLQQLVAMWGRDTLGLTPAQYDQKVQVYKQLTWLWEDDVLIGSRKDRVPYWGQGNTVLIDDSAEKAASEPFNLVQVDTFENTPDQREADVLGQVVQYLEGLKWQKNVSGCIMRQPFRYDAEVGAYDWREVGADVH